MKFYCLDQEYFEQLKPAKVGSDISLVEVGLYPPKDHNGKIIYVGNNVDLGQVIDLLREASAVAVVQRNKRIENDLEYAGRLQEKGSQLITDPVKLQIPAVEYSERVEFSSHLDKKEIILRLEEFVTKSGVQNVSDTLRSIVEELFMNAIFDAPREAIKKGWGVDYVKGLKSSFDFGYDEEHFCISCSDPFGSLDVDYLLQRLRIVYDKGAGKSINFGEGGAGLGCFILLENSVQMTIAVRAKKATFFSCLVPRFSSRKDRVLHSKSLHVVRYL